MTPYYHHGGITLYHGDARDITDWHWADVLVTDPPYGQSYNSGLQPHKHARFGPIAGDHDTALRDEIIATYFDRYRPDGEPPAAAAVFGTWKTAPPADVAAKLIWNKHGVGPGMGDLSTPFGPSFEEIYLLGRWIKPDGYRRRGSVITTTEHPIRTAELIRHPTPKPVGLMETLIDATPAGATIADPFAGSGSTLIAARNLGRIAVGVEIREDYCELTARRLDQMAIDFGSII